MEQEQDKVQTDNFLKSEIENCATEKPNLVDENSSIRTEESEEILSNNENTEEVYSGNSGSEEEWKVLDKLSSSESGKNGESNEEKKAEKQPSKELLEEPGASGDKAETEDGWQDILGSGVIMKKIVTEGEPDTRPNRSDKCVINYKCRLEHSSETDFCDQVENFELGLGEGDVVQGLDVAIGLMNKKERCLLKIGNRLAYGSKGLPPYVPGSANVVFDVELVDVLPEDEFENMNVQERRKMGNKKKERGNWWYQRGEHTLAIQCYRKALDYLDEVEDTLQNTSKLEHQEILEDRLKVLNNMASAQIKMELHDQAMTSLETVLRCQPFNVKAMYRKSKILTAKQHYEEALQLLNRAKEYEPTDALIGKEIVIVNRLLSNEKSKEKEYTRRMFGEFADPKTRSSTGKPQPKVSVGYMKLCLTLGASVLVGVAGVLAYKLKY